jgi:hypothetical protein
MDPEQPQQGGIHNPMIMIAIVAGVAILAYFLFFRNSSGTGSTSGGGGSVTSGATTLDKGAVTISVTQSPNDQATNNGGQPVPPTHHKKKTVSQHLTPPAEARQDARQEARQDKRQKAKK